jgi:AraC family transcriptional regulator of adaptative response/methylated-DNA-[protein]-cysteine methyltransferase
MTIQRTRTISVQTVSMQETIHLQLSDDECWGAVLKRDAAFDGVFFTCVKTTGIYCRPSCKARTPLRHNVLFASSTAAAREAGFRACLRCKPDETTTINSHTELVQRICRDVEGINNEQFSVDTLAERFQISAAHLQRVFKQVMGVSLKQYARGARDERFKSLVKSGLSVTEAMYEAGYGSSSRLYEQSAQRLGMTPAAYKRGGADVEIHYVIAPCALGHIVIAATDKGICAIRLGDTQATLEQELHDEFSSATIVNASESDERLGDWLRTLTLHIEGKHNNLSALALTLDVQATAFQLRVWEELRRIPYGETRSYSDVASAIGQPSAVRAVASACAANPIALVTPCHRVLRAGGELSGYRWGVERKRELLRRERQVENVCVHRHEQSQTTIFAVQA